MTATHAVIASRRSNSEMVEYKNTVFLWIASSFLLAMTLRTDRHCEPAKQSRKNRISKHYKILSLTVRVVQQAQALLLKDFQLYNAVVQRTNEEEIVEHRSTPLILCFVCVLLNVLTSRQFQPSQEYGLMDSTDRYCLLVMRT